MQSVLELSDIMLIIHRAKLFIQVILKHFTRKFLKPLSDPEQKAFEEGKDKIYHFGYLS